MSYFIKLVLQTGFLRCMLPVQLINLKNRHSFMGEKSFVQKVVFDGPPKEDAKVCCFCGAYMIIINVD